MRTRWMDKPWGNDGRYRSEGGEHRGNDGHLCPVRLRGKGVATAAPEISLSSIRSRGKGGAYYSRDGSFTIDRDNTADRVEG